MLKNKDRFSFFNIHFLLHLMEKRLVSAEIPMELLKSLANATIVLLNATFAYCSIEMNSHTLSKQL